LCVGLPDLGDQPELRPGQKESASEREGQKAFPFLSIEASELVSVRQVAQMEQREKQQEGQGEVCQFADETLEDLQRSGFRLLQKRNGFRFGLDSVLLAAYAASFYPVRADGTIRIADLGAGCGAVSLLLAGRLPTAQLTGIEIDPVSVDVFQRNRILNQLESRLEVVAGDIRRLPSTALPARTFDLVVSNPPYFRPERSLRRPHPDAQPQARQESSLDLDDLLYAASRLLKPHGRFVVVHQVARLPEILTALAACKLEPKTLRLVQSLPERAPVLCLLSAQYQGKPGGFKAEPTLLVNERPGVPSRELAAWYGAEPPLTREELRRGVRLMPGGSDRKGDE
jgi:tRNA1Val (adenine37-N6)-methyltransferase